MKILFLFILSFFVAGRLFAGGIITNSNQSARFVRLLSLNASYGIDATYFNPAGLVRMQDGFHLSFNNQTIFQEKTVSTTFPGLNNNTYIGDVSVPLFPSFFAVYKKNKLALSFGLGINGGGGSAEYKTGLPSFEIPYSTIPTLVSNMGVPTNNYAADIYFDGSSIFFGTQIGASYAVNEIFSFSSGIRIISAKNVYEGHIKDVQINPQFPGNPEAKYMSASSFFNAVGKPEYAAMTSDMTVNATQTGMGFTPILGANIKLIDKLNIGIKYEFKTKLELTNKADADKDANGKFKNDSTFRNDIPGFLSFGIEYCIRENLRVSASWNHYFDKDADWNGKEKFIDNNLYEVALGLEHDLSDKITLSCGFAHKQSGVGQGYQTDISYNNSSNTVGFGGRLNISDKLSIDLGVLFSMYTTANEEKMYNNTISYKETYDKSLKDFAIGINYKF